MPVFKVNIDQPLTKWNRFTRFVEASTAEAAQAIAETLLPPDNEEPDDAYSGLFDEDAGEWSVNEVELASDEDLADAEPGQLHGFTADNVIVGAD